MSRSDDNKLLGYEPHGFALEINPWQTTRSIEQALLYRGAIVAGWASVETALIEIAIRSSKHPAYQCCRLTYPSKLKSRVAYLRSIMDLAGPLSPYQSLGHKVLDRYTGSAGLRNMMAHGWMSVLPDWGATFQFFQPVDGASIKIEERRFSLDELSYLARRSTRFSRTVRYGLAYLNSLELLPPLVEPS